VTGSDKGKAEPATRDEAGGEDTVERNTPAESENTEAESAAAEAAEPPKGDADAPEDEMPEAADAQAAAEVPRRKGGFLARLVGGVLGAVAGVAATLYFMPTEGGDTAGADAAIAALSTRVAELEAQVSKVSALEAQLAGLSTRIEEIGKSLDGLAPARIDELDAALAAVANRVAGLEAEMSRIEALARQAAERPATAPSGQDGTQAAAAAAKEVEALVAKAEERLRRVEARAAELEEAARDAADRAARRAAIERIGVAVEAGGRFEEALRELEALGVEVPPALAEAGAEGVPTLLELQRRFPEAARRALREARKAEAGEGLGERVVGFLKAEVGVRSITPREGSDPDAVLSRAEAAVAEGRLADALAEIAALPDPARAALADWEDAARRRLEAVAAFRQLSSAG